KQDRPRLVDVVGRAETQHAAFVLGEAIDPAARGAVEGHLVAIAEKEILTEVFAKLLEEIAQAPDDGIVAQNSVLFLRAVPDVEIQQDNHHQHYDQHAQAGLQCAQHPFSSPSERPSDESLAA